MTLSYHKMDTTSKMSLQQKIQYSKEKRKKKIQYYYLIQRRKLPKSGMNWIQKS